MKIKFNYIVKRVAWFFCSYIDCKCSYEDCLKNIEYGSCMALVMKKREACFKK